MLLQGSRYVSYAYLHIKKLRHNKQSTINSKKCPAASFANIALF